MATEDHRGLAAAVTAERYAAGGPGELAPLLRGWVCRYALLGARPCVVHHVDPAAPATSTRKGAAYCDVALAVDALWWRVPDGVVAEALAGDEQLWWICPVCAAAVAAAAD